MKKTTLFKTATLFLGLLLLGFIAQGCGKDDDTTTDDCKNFPVSSGTITVDGTSSKISVKQLIINDPGGGFGTTYTMQIAAISSDCNKLTSINLNVSFPSSGTKLNGTYKILPFFDAEDGDASGSIITQVINPVSQNSTDLKSGTAKITDKGSKLYTIDINAVDVSGSTLTMKGDVQF